MHPEGDYVDYIAYIPHALVVLPRPCANARIKSKPQQKVIFFSRRNSVALRINHNSQQPLG